MKVLHIGPVTSVHTQIAALGYQALGVDATFLNTRKDVPVTAVPGVPASFDVINPWAGMDVILPGTRAGSSLAASVLQAARYLGMRDTALIRACAGLAATHEFDVIVGTWGVPVLDAMLEASRAFPRAAVIYNILTVPELPIEGTDWRRRCWRAYGVLFNAVERSAFRRMLRKSDVRVHASAQMESYLRRKGMLGGPGADIVRLERFSRAFFPRRRLQKRSATTGEPNVVHLGATNFSGQNVDNLTAHLARLAGAKIHVHFASSNGDSRGQAASEYYHDFPKFAGNVVGPELAEFSTQFDAAILLYNVERPYDRFINALPTRFLFALTTGIPIVMPRGLFQACEDYVTLHDIGFVYDSEPELAATLADRARMDSWERNARMHAESASLEDNLEEYEALFQRATDSHQARLRSLDPRSPRTLEPASR
jgi:hypothetical protein